MGMELDNERIHNDDAGDEVHNVKDLELLEQLCLDLESMVIISTHVIAMMRHMIRLIRIMMTIFNTCKNHTT